jgi:hypothetical protein
VEAEIFDFIGLRKLNIIDFNRWAGCTPRSEGDSYLPLREPQVLNKMYFKSSFLIRFGLTCCDEARGVRIGLSTDSHLLQVEELFCFKYLKEINKGNADEKQ